MMIFLLIKIRFIALIMLLALITPTNASLASRPSFSGSEIGVPPPPQPRRRSSTSSDIHELLTVDVSIKTEGDGGEKIVKSVVDSGAQGERGRRERGGGWTEPTATISA